MSSAVELPWHDRPRIAWETVNRPPVWNAGLAGSTNGLSSAWLATQTVLSLPNVASKSLLLVRVAKADGQIELRRDVEDVVGEQRPVAALLVVSVLGRAEIVESSRFSNAW